MSKAFKNINMDVLNSFKKISLQKKMISKLKREIVSLNRDLESLKEENWSLVNENLCIFSSLKERVKVVDCITFLILKLK